MTNSLTDAEARVALDQVKQGRQRVIDQIGMPRWYWWGLATCWIVLGVLNDVANVWVIAVATVTFGAVHSAVSQRLLAGRRSSPSRTVLGRWEPSDGSEPGQIDRARV